MIDRLELLTNRYNEINEELLKPEVLSDFNKQKKLSKEKGSIEEGKDADITIFDNNIECQMTIVEGNIVYKKI